MADDLVVSDPGGPATYAPATDASPPDIGSSGLTPHQILAFSAAVHEATVVERSSSRTPLIRLQRPVMPPASRRIHYVRSCEEITQPGRYVLLADLTGGASCLTIHDTHNVDLECGGHSITNHLNGIVSAGVNVQNVNNFTMNSCNVQSHFDLPDGSASDAVDSLTITNAQNVQVTHCHLREVDVLNVAGGAFLDNQIAGFYQQNSSSYMCLKGNDLTAPNDKLTAGVIVSNEGSHNKFVENHIDGGWDGSPDTYEKLGADDGIIVTDESNDVIQGNVIANNWDAGIEPVGVFNNSVIADNQIQNSEAAIGAYWQTS